MICAVGLRGLVGRRAPAVPGLLGRALVGARSLASEAVSPAQGSSASTAAEESSAGQSSPKPFEYPKAEDLFRRIVEEKSADDVRLVADEVNRIVGRPIRQNEFYYNGFGGRRVGGGGGGSAASAVDDAAPEEAEQQKPKTVDLKLAGFEAKSKIKVIKEVRAVTSLGLKEAKELVEGAPATVAKDLKPEEAEELKAKFEAVGAQMELV